MALRRPTVPKPYNWNIYGGTINTMKNLYRQYANTRFNYKPQKFEYSEFGGRKPYDQQAQERVQSQLAAGRIGTNQAVSAANQQYRIADEQARANEGASAAAINRQAEIDAGRMSNMLANTGVQGQGAATEMYGLRGVAAQQIADNAVKYGLERSQAAGAKAQMIAQAQAQQAMAEAASVAQQQELADQLYGNAMNSYLQQRGQAYSEYGDWENRSYQTAQDAYQSQLNALNNQLGVLGQMSTLYGQTSQNQYQDMWNRYNALYGQYSDATSLAENRRQSTLANQQYLAGLAAQQNAAQLSYDATMAEINKPNQPIVMFNPQTGGYDQFLWNPTTGSYILP